MNRLTKEYLRLRALGFRSQEALRDARTHIDFELAEDTGAVKFEIVPDDLEPYDDSYIDTWNNVPKGAREKYRKELWNRIERHGTFGIRSYALDPYTYTLEEVDSVWGFIGDDWKDSGYDSNLKRNALDKLRDYVHD